MCRVTDAMKADFRNSKLGNSHHDSLNADKGLNNNNVDPRYGQPSAHITPENQSCNRSAPLPARSIFSSSAIFMESTEHNHLIRVHITSYSTLIETMHLSCNIFELVICQQSLISTYPTCIWHSIWGDPVRILLRSLASEN